MSKPALNTQEKILSRAELAARLAAHCAVGERHQCSPTAASDILHVGHAALSASRAARGRRACGGDKFRRPRARPQGRRGRPILSQDARAQLVAATRRSLLCRDNFQRVQTSRRCSRPSAPTCTPSGTDYTVDTGARTRNCAPDCGGAHRHRRQRRSQGPLHTGSPELMPARPAEWLAQKMASPKIQSACASPAKFLVIRLGSPSVTLCTQLPAVAALRRKYPDARMDWVVEQRWSPLIQMVTVVDEAIPLQRSLSGQLACIRRLRRADYDCAVDFQGLYKSALLGWFSGAPRRIGRDRSAAREPGAAWFYTDGVNPQGRHVAQMSLSVAVQVGVDNRRQSGRSAQLASRFNPRQCNFRCGCRTPQPAIWSAKLALEGIADYVVLSPGGGWVSKCWPPERYGALCARQLWQRRKMRCIVNAGPGEEELALEVVRTAADDAKPLAMTAPLPELAASCAAGRAPNLWWPPTPDRSI